MRNLTDLLTVFVGHREVKREPAAETDNHCLACDADLGDSELYRRYRICEHCRFHYSLSARRRIELLADPGTFK